MGFIRNLLALVGLVALVGVGFIVLYVFRILIPVLAKPI